MTDYHSPWRFPPLRPYVDEPKQEKIDRPNVLPMSLNGSARNYGSPRTNTSSEPESMSQKIERLYGAR